MSWTFLFQVASACGKTKHNIREKKICLRGECRKGVTGTLGIGFGCLYSWSGMLLTTKSGVLSLLVGAPCLESVFCEAVVSKIYLVEGLRSQYLGYL